MKKPTIYEALREKLGREPTNAEIKADIQRILEDGVQEMAAKRAAQDREDHDYWRGRAENEAAIEREEAGDA